MPKIEYPNYELIEVEVDADTHVGQLTMNVPKKLNALGVPILHEMLDGVNRLNADRNVRVAILTGAGRGFCAGADLTDSTVGTGVNDHLQQDHRPVLDAIGKAPKPWISAVKGVCAGIGSAYAMNCDLTVMSEDAYIYQAFAGIGLVPDGGATWLLANALGRKRAYEVIATGEKVSAQKCLEWGLCNRVVPTDTLLSEARDWAGELAQRAPLSLRHAKDAMRTATTSDYGATFDREVELQKICSASEDSREAIKAFREKRTPTFNGR